MLSPYLIIPYEENATTVYSFFVYYSKSHKLNGIYLVLGGICSCVFVCVCVHVKVTEQLQMSFFRIQESFTLFIEGETGVRPDGQETIVIHLPLSPQL